MRSGGASVSSDNAPGTCDPSPGSSLGLREIAESLVDNGSVLIYRQCVMNTSLEPHFRMGVAVRVYEE